MRNPREQDAGLRQPHVRRAGFILWQLQKQGKLTGDDIKPGSGSFDKLDADGSGFLNQVDITDQIRGGGSAIGTRDAPAEDPFALNCVQA